MKSAQAKRILRTIAVVAILYVSLVVAGLGVVFATVQDRPVAAGICIAGVGLVAWITMDWWLGYLPGVLGVAIFNGFGMAASGRLLTNPSKPVPRAEALIVALLLCVGAFWAVKLDARRLGKLSRIAVMGFLAAMLLAFARNDLWVWAVATSMGFLGLAVVIREGARELGKD